MPIGRFHPRSQQRRPRNDGPGMPSGCTAVLHRAEEPPSPGGAVLRDLQQIQR